MTDNGLNGGESTYTGDNTKELTVGYAIATGKLDLLCSCGHRLGVHKAFGPSRCGDVACECRRARLPRF